MWKYAVFVFLIFELLILFGTLEEIPNQYCFLWFLFFLDLQAQGQRYTSWTKDNSLLCLRFGELCLLFPFMK